MSTPRTRQLWLSIGMDVGWNFFQGPVFGYAASGHETTCRSEPFPGTPPLQAQTLPVEE